MNLNLNLTTEHLTFSDETVDIQNGVNLTQRKTVDSSNSGPVSFKRYNSNTQCYTGTRYSFAVAMYTCMRILLKYSCITCVIHYL